MNAAAHNYYEDQYYNNNDKENQVVLAQHYNRYRKGNNLIRKSADPNAAGLSRQNRVNNISNIVEGVERRINDVLSQNRERG